MRLSFGRIIPVKAYIDKVPADKPQTIAVSDIMCAYLEKRDYYPNDILIEQQRRFFASQVPDYQLPKGPYQPNDNSKSAVYPFSVEDKRYLATGEDINWVKTYGHDYGRAVKDSNAKIDKKLAFDIRKLQEGCKTPDDYESAKEAAPELEHQAELEKKAEAYRLNQNRINQLKAMVNIPGKRIAKTLNIMASPNPKAKKDKEAYTITLIDFKA